MARYDGLIIPRSYSDYINKTDAATLVQALQQNNVMDTAPTKNSDKPAKSGGIFSANAVIMASGTTLTGVTIASGSIIRVMFTAAITGSNTTTGLSLTYNGTAYAVKIGKNGALSNFVAAAVGAGYIYVQAYTTLELAFDGTQFIIIGNPVVISSTDYTIYADGQTRYNYLSSSKSTAYKNCLQSVGQLSVGGSVTLTPQHNENYLGGMVRIARLNCLILFDFWNSNVQIIGNDTASQYISVEKESNSNSIKITNNWTGRVDYALYT